MKKHVIGLLLAAFALHASAVVIQGELPDGSYKNYAIDSAGALTVSSGTGTTTVKPYAVTANDWSYAAIAGGIVNTTDVVVKAAGAAGIRNYVTGLTCQNAAAAVATEIVLKDGATVIWRGYLGLVAQGSSVISVTFPTPLKSTAATALNLAAITTAAQVYCNLQGYTGP